MKRLGDNSGGDTGGTRKNPPKDAFTLVEMIVTLLVACILMVAVVAFLVNGVVSTTKTTAINDSTAKGRYVFEHLSKEMARANDLTISPTPAGGFFGPNPNYAYPPTPTPGNPGLGYQGFNYMIPVGGQALNKSGTIPVTAGVSPGIVLNLAASSAPDYLVPQAGDYIQIPGLSLGTPKLGVQIASVTSPNSPDGSGDWVIYLSAPLYTLANVAATVSRPTSRPRR